MRLILPASFCLCFLLSYPAFAQLNNKAFTFRDTIQPSNENKLNLSVQAFSFFKNNEYFNDIVPGYTLFGYQINPELTYQPSAHFKIRAGIFAWKDFGNRSYTRIEPTFSLKYQKDSFALIFGTLEGALTHQLIEPLFDFERIINNRQENGLQLLYQKKRIRADLWVDWLQMIYKDSPFQEEISVGFSGAFTWVKKDNFTLESPLQIQMFHRGGQIGQYATNLTNWFNGAVGISSRHIPGPSSAIRKIRMDAYVAWFQDFSSRKVNIYAYGSGLYLNIALESKWLEVMASYWQANRFRSWQGGNLYQSVAVFPPRINIALPDPNAKPEKTSPRAIVPITDTLPYRETDRELLVIRLMKDFKIMNGLIFTLRIEPVYNLPMGTFEFSHGFYITYRQQFLLKKVKPLESD
jgi:hypothetical protein